MNESELNTYWQLLLDQSKDKLPFPIWEKVILSGLFPLSYENDIIYLSVMENYKKNLANTAQIMEVLIKTSISILQKDVQIRILDTDEAQKFMMQGSSYTTDPVKISTFEAPSPIESAPSISSFKPDDLYEPPVIIPQKQKVSFELPPATLEQPAPRIEIVSERKEEDTLTLNPSFTFDSFVVGNSNRIAVATAKNVAEKPGESFNPLLIQGLSGLGKTHLMQAIGNEIHATHKNFKIKYLTSETFLNNFVDSLRTGQNQLFREMYRNVDVLLIDDIQFFQSKERGKTQEEFFNTFEALKEANKQIIMTSDVLPVDMQDLPNRLRSRFESGMIVTIEEPDMETRLAILRNKYESAKKNYPNAQISDEVLTYFSEKLNTNVRTLGGALNQAVMISNSQLLPFSIDQAITIVQRLIGNKKAHHITADLIQEIVSLHFGIKKSDLIGTKRKKEIAFPRQIAMFLCRDMIQLSYPSIASYFNKKDHTTIIHGYEKISKEIKTDAAMHQLVEDLKKRIQNP